MTALTHYTSLHEKDNFFQTGSAVINSIQDFESTLKYLESIPQGQFIFRGLKEAKYKLYTTSQRKFIDINTCIKRSSYKTFILNEINNFLASEHKELQEYLVNAKISNDNYLAFLSIMQHYGRSTPCLDFSADPLVALFFAFKDTSPVCETQIEEYVSLYSLSREFSAQYFFNLGKTMIEGFMFKKIFKNEKSNFNLNSRIPFDILFGFDLPICIDITTNSCFNFKTRNNQRLIKQKGLLLFNPDPILSLEELSKKIYSDYKGPEWKEIKCLNFHKGLHNYVLDLLNERGISHAELFID
jgi:hypothetical protein